MRLELAALTLLALTACGPQDLGCPNGVLVVTTNERDATQSGVLPLDGTPAVMVAAPVGLSDPALATSAGRHFLIDRTQDLIYELDSCGHGGPPILARSFDAQSTPVDAQDVAVDSTGILWVARLLSPSLLVLRQQETEIDLSKLDPDGIPDASSIRIIDRQAFVALERLTNDVSTLPSQIAVLDTTSLGLVKQIQLQGRNPLGLMVESPGKSPAKLWLAEPGNFDSVTEPDAGIEVVDTTSLTSTLLIPETTLGASAIEVAVNGTCGAAILADATPNVNHTSLVSFSLDGSNLATAIPPTPGFDLRGLAWLPDGRLLVGDQQPKIGGFPVHVLTPSASCALTAGVDLTVPDLPAFAFAP